MTWLLYGAYGYTGQLIAREAAGQGGAPVLAGRDAGKVRALAEELRLESRVFGLDDHDAIVDQLAGCDAVLNVAGPFSQTARPLMEACLAATSSGPPGLSAEKKSDIKSNSDRSGDLSHAAGVHYLDITGEIDVIEAAAALDARAKQAGIVIMPAVGFDVVPTDCLAAMLAARLPTATHLQLAFHAGADMSPGTAKTMVEALPRGGRVRRDGKIVRVPLAFKSRQIPFPDRTRWATTIPWGDVASAYYSTGIENIEVYLAMPRARIRMMRAMRWLAPLGRLSLVQSLWKKWITRVEKGPSAEKRSQNRAVIWGEVADAEGNKASAVMTTPDGYALTIETALAAVERVTPSSGPRAAAQVAPGFHTPSTAFGADFILQFDGVSYDRPSECCGAG